MVEVEERKMKEREGAAHEHKGRDRTVANAKSNKKEHHEDKAPDKD